MFYAARAGLEPAWRHNWCGFTRHLSHICHNLPFTGIYQKDKVFKFSNKMEAAGVESAAGV